MCSNYILERKIFYYQSINKYNEYPNILIVEKNKTLSIAAPKKKKTLTQLMLLYDFVRGYISMKHRKFQPSILSNAANLLSDRLPRASTKGNIGILTNML